MIQPGKSTSTQSEWKATFITDDWEGFHRLISEAQLFTGKDLTFPIEQDNSNIRHYLARFRRRTKVASQNARSWPICPCGFTTFRAIPKTTPPSPPSSYLSLIRTLKYGEPNGHLEKYLFRVACKSDSKNLFEFDHRERVRWGNWVSLI
ncbi:MAG: hypothetical protein M3Z96_05525 [Pseudomonadota bacterium]|nr:hypothetical protein [Pseudomonadota bacterium]